MNLLEPYSLPQDPQFGNSKEKKKPTTPPHPENPNRKLQPLFLKFITLVIAEKRVRVRTADMQGPAMEPLVRSLTTCLYIFSVGSRSRGMAVLVALPLEDLSHAGWGCWRKSRNHLEILSSGSLHWGYLCYTIKIPRQGMVQYGHIVKGMCLKNSILLMRERNLEGKNSSLRSIFLL